MNTVVPVDTVYTDVLVCMALLVISLQFKKVRGGGGALIEGQRLFAILAEGWVPIQ